MASGLTTRFRAWRVIFKKLKISSSFVHQAIFAVVVSTLPLIALTLWFSSSLQQSSSQMRDFYKLSQQVERDFKVVSQGLKALQDAEQNNQILQDSQLTQTLENKWFEVENMALALKKYARSEGFVADLQQLQQTMQLHAKSDDTFARIWRDYYQLTDTLKADLEQTQQQLDAHIAQQQWLFFIGLSVLVPLLAAVSIRLLVKVRSKLSAIENAAEQLGVGEWETPIVLSGSAELAKLGARLNWLRLSLKSQHEEQDTFLRHVSHELKTPLASMVEGTSLLNEQVLGALNAQQTRVLSIMDKSAVQLKALIEDLLLFSGTAKLTQLEQNKPCGELKTELQQYFADLPMAQHKQLNWQLDGLEQLSVPFLPCKLALTQVISNALRFAEYHVEVSFSKAADGYQFVVTDDGQGFSEEAASRALEPFYKGAEQQHNNEATMHSGLGLSIAHECCKAMSGTLNIRAQQGGHVTIKFGLGAA
jgi:two-component system sensor histidine kinase GlrK